MADENSNRRGETDQTRDKSVYHYLLTRLTALDILDDTKKPNEYHIAKQWGQNRIFVRRVLRFVLPDFYKDEENKNKDEKKKGKKTEPLPRLTLGKLVDILASLEQYWNEQRKQDSERIPKIITREQKLQALQKFSQLLPEERKALKLPIQPHDNLLEQLKETITDKERGLTDKERDLTDKEKGLDEEKIIAFYKQAITLFHSLKHNQSDLNLQIEALEDKNSDLLKQIEHDVETKISEYYSGLESKVKTDKKEQLVEKIKRQLSRIEFQSGRRQLREISNQLPEHIKQKTDKELFCSLFLESLTYSSVENEILGDDFPIHIEYIEVRKANPLPLYLEHNNSSKGLLNTRLLDKDRNENETYVKGLEKQISYKVYVHFYIDIEKRKLSNKYEKIRNYLSQKEQNRIEFYEEVRGIGSPISHIVKGINQLLFENIPILKDYLPVAQEILNEDHVIGNSSNSPTRSYTLVQLCRKEDIQKALENNFDYNQIAINQELSFGEYCGFDLVESSAKAALYARLRAIQKVGIDPDKYMQQLCDSVCEKYILKKANNYLHSYPFSLRVMQDYLNINLNIIKNSQDIKTIESKNLQDNNQWTNIQYEAYLKIIQAYLQEGLYRYVKNKLEIIQTRLDNKLLEDQLLIALYYLCQFRYHYYTDLNDSESPHHLRSAAIRKADDYLNKAEDTLKYYLKQYAIIGEYSQSNAHPFFYLLSRIYAHRAKIYIFFPYNAERPISGENRLIESIRLLEKARIYAARDGDSNHYAYWTVYQVLCYLITAYIGDEQQLGSEFSRENCINWGKRLIAHALTCYAEEGKTCYQQIKDNSGKRQISKSKKVYNTTVFYENYDNVFVENVPPIVELFEKNETQSNQNDQSRKLLELPMYLLTVDGNIINGSQDEIYLFGVYSSFLLFGKGLMELCDDIEDEKQLEANLVMAMKRFTLCAAIAAEGTKDDNIDNNINIDKDSKNYLERIFDDKDKDMPEEFRLRGLYPHRLTHFAALGKVFAATSKVILVLYNQTEYPYWEEIKYLLEDLYDKKTIKEQNELVRAGQERYNGHLADQLAKVKQYLEDYKTKNIDFSSLIEIRNRLVSDIFKIMRGDKVE